MTSESPPSDPGQPVSLRCTIITISDTRTLDDDECGNLVARLLSRHGHDVVERTVVPDDVAKVSLVLRHWFSADDVDGVFVGRVETGLRRGSVDVVREFLDLELPGYGELYRALSYQQTGAAAMLCAAVGGTALGKLVFTLPGPPGAVQLGLEKLILPQLRSLGDALRKAD